MFAKWFAYDPDNCDEDDARPMMAFDGEDAAKKYAEWSDHHSAEYTYAREGGSVMVRAEGGPWVRYEVTGESVPVYHARPAKPRPTAASGDSEGGGRG